MARFSAVAALVLASGLVWAAESEQPRPQNLVSPAAYRILVKYNDKIIARVTEEIDREIVKSVEERRRRLRQSEEELTDLIKKEIESYREELEAVEKAEREEGAARQRGDIEEAERWRLLKLERTRNALDLARRVRAIEEALARLSVENWRVSRREQRAIAEKALIRLEATLEEIRTGRAD